MYIDECNGDADGLCAVVQCRLLEAGVSVRYFDQHKVDDIPVHPLLDAHIDVASDTCTNLPEPFIDAFSATQWRDARCVPGDS
jgi:hypothetical protein